MTRTIIRYQVKLDRVAENEALVRAVYAELHERQPAGMAYATYKLDDGVSFVHISLVEDDGRSPLLDLRAFQAFLKDVNDRCDVLPVSSQITEIGRYRDP
jgi:hypothetical protein